MFPPGIHHCSTFPSQYKTTSHIYTANMVLSLPVPVSTSLSENSKELLSVYMEGVRDSSKMLLELTEYFDEMDEPVLLCFSETTGQTYKMPMRNWALMLGKTILPSTIYTFQVPFVIWQNRAYAKLNPFTQLHERLDLPENRKLSGFPGCCHL